ncbi:pyridoxal phosphate-dependent transferase [Aspergillus heterothallicus]
MSRELRPSWRAQLNRSKPTAWDLMETVSRGPLYDPVTNPNGLINLSGAVNNLMRDYLDQYCPLPYGPLPGTDGLREAFARFFEHFFAPQQKIQPDQIICGNGVTGLIDLVAYTICDPGDGILFPAPNFYMFNYDVSTRADVQAISVPCDGITDQYSAQGSRELCARFQEYIEDARKRGVTVRALFVCNPSNPEGRCYSRSALRIMSEFCSRVGVYLVVDEIYALSQFGCATDAEAEFTSALSILSSRNNIILYSLSKDFGLGGLRLGAMVSRNAELIACMKKASFFTWVATFSDLFVQRFLGDLAQVARYLRTYRALLSDAFRITTNALSRAEIPYHPSTSGLFVFLNLSQYLELFKGVDGAPSMDFPSWTSHEHREESREIQLCKYLVQEASVFLNPGEFACSSEPGRFRLVFTDKDPDTVTLAISRLRSFRGLTTDKDELEGRYSTGTVLKSKRESRGFLKVV